MSIKILKMYLWNFFLFKCDSVVFFLLFYAQVLTAIFSVSVEVHKLWIHKKILSVQDIVLNDKSRNILFNKGNFLFFGWLLN